MHVDILQARILIVDDNPVNIHILRQILRDHGLTVLTAQSGEDSLELLRSEKVDLILLDVMMPGLDGFETCEILKQNPLLADIPVIFLTARSDSDDVLKGFSVGAVDYVTKPFRAEELLMRVRSHVELYMTRQLIEMQNRTLEKLSKDKSELLSIAAHDLKNPLSGIMGLSEFLLEDSQNYDSNTVRLIGEISGAANKMFKLISNILSLNRIEEGALDVDVAEFDAERAIDELLESVRAVAHRKGQTLVKDVSHPDSIFEPLTSDRVLVGQIMENLVSNAIKYSPFGATIRIGLVYTLAGLRFEIDDQGPGFTEEDKKRMFGRFVRLSAQPTGGESSTGLGLSLVKMLTELLGGTVECSSLSTGSRFTVFLPYSLSPHAVPATI